MRVRSVPAGVAGERGDWAEADCPGCKALGKGGSEPTDALRMYRRAWSSASAFLAAWDCCAAWSTHAEPRVSSGCACPCLSEPMELSSDRSSDANSSFPRCTACVSASTACAIACDEPRRECARDKSLGRCGIMCGT